jgi:ABC-type proline/glycine betaine transport system permease subunit
MNLFARRSDQRWKPGEGAMNNTSMFTADRTTHLKIVVVSLVCAMLVAGVGIAARANDGATGNVRMEATVIKAGSPVQAATTNGSTVR